MSNPIRTVYAPYNTLHQTLRFGAIEAGLSADASASMHNAASPIVVAFRELLDTGGPIQKVSFDPKLGLTVWWGPGKMITFPVSSILWFADTDPETS